MIQHRRLGILAIAIGTVLATVFPAAALAAPTDQTIPGSRNLVALATPDMQVAVTVWAPPTPQTQADAGAFATGLIQEFGLVGIPNFEPASQLDSVLVCSSSLNPVETIGVYGIRGYGVTEATVVCSTMQAEGSPIVWEN